MISKRTTPVNEFSDSFLNEIFTRLEAAIARDPAAPRIAAFDADGTLWDTDLGEAFFQFQIRECGLPGMPADPWLHYHEWKKTDPVGAYGWLAQINKGQTLAQVRAWAKRSVAAMGPLPLFASQMRLIDWLHDHRFQVYIVTASVKWAVEPGGVNYRVLYDQVLGITTEIEDGGVISDRVLQPITWRQGKADNLLRTTGGVRPMLCSGNTLGDIALLSTATDVALAVSTAHEPCELFDEEEKLRNEASARGWLHHWF